MKKFILIGLFVFITLLTITGCKNKRNNKNENTSKLTCKQKTDNFNKKYIFYLDKDNKLIDGTFTEICSNIKEAEMSYKIMSSSVGGYDSVKRDGNKVKASFKADSQIVNQMKKYMADLNKDNIKKYFENNEESIGWKCK